MFEARIKYIISGRTHIVEADTIERLKAKCKFFINNEMVTTIEVFKIEECGWLKLESMDKTELL